MNGEWRRMVALRKEKVEKDFEIKGERKNMERNMRKNDQLSIIVY